MNACRIHIPKIKCRIPNKQPDKIRIDTTQKTYKVFEWTSGGCIIKKGRTIYHHGLVTIESYNDIKFYESYVDPVLFTFLARRNNGRVEALYYWKYYYGYVTMVSEPFSIIPSADGIKSSWIVREYLGYKDQGIKINYETDGYGVVIAYENF